MSERCLADGTVPALRERRCTAAGGERQHRCDLPFRLAASAEADLACGLFAAWRFDAEGREIADLVLNGAPFRTAGLLSAGPNFGCGSSREAAAWAFKRHGFGWIAVPFFHENALRNGLLPTLIPEAWLARALALSEAEPHRLFRVDLEAEAIITDGGDPIRCDIEPYRKEALLRGDAEIASTLRHTEVIAAIMRGLDLVMISDNVLTVAESVWAVRADSPIWSMKDMRGGKIGFALTLIGTLLGEMFASQRGLGYMLMNAIGLHHVDIIMSITLLVLVFAVSVSLLLIHIDRRLPR